MSEYDGRQFVGIDLHRRRTVIVRHSETGEHLATKRIVNDPLALAREIGKAGPEPEVVLEATYGWYWAADVLAETGARVHLAHPLGIKGFTNRRVKTCATPPTLRICCGWVACPSPGSRRRRSGSCAS